jgi:hypothetical protein
MSIFRSIMCPKFEDHEKPKKLMFIGSKAIYVNCHAHAWIKIELYKAGKQMDFDNVSVITRSMGPAFTFDHKPIPVLASGEFKMKPSFERYKKNAEYHKKLSNS